MHDANGVLLLSYGPGALARFAPAGAPWRLAWVWSPPPSTLKGALARFAPAGAPWRLAWVWSPPPSTLKGPAPIASPKGPASPAPEVAVGEPVGYPRGVVDACLARARSVNAFALADAMLRAEPFASARPVGAVVRGGVAYYGSINPWDQMWPPGRFADRPAERGAYAIEVARYYAAAIANGSARPRDMAPNFFDRATEPVPSLERTTAWVNAWARWALDAVQIALDTPETRDRVAAALLGLCRSWDPTVIP